LKENSFRVYLKVPTFIEVQQLAEDQDLHQPKLFENLKRVRLTRVYAGLACVYGVSTLLIPFTTQFLVNNLALTGLWVSTFTFLGVTGAFLLASLFVKYLQYVLLEYIQRTLLFIQLSEWQRKVDLEDRESPYYFEVFSMLKSFSTIVSSGIDLGLKAFFGGLALVFIHPGFLILWVVFIFFLVLIRRVGKNGVTSSVEESTAKYNLYYRLMKSRHRDSGDAVTDVFRARHAHFYVVRKQTRLVFASHFVVQMILLVWGIYLVQLAQLSIGQFVSAEIIVSGIYISFANFPKILESFYDFETSCLKLDSLKVKEVENESRA
jgi:putative ABC transport system ATP-binding protein